MREISLHWCCQSPTYVPKLTHVGLCHCNVHHGTLARAQAPTAGPHFEPLRCGRLHLVGHRPGGHVGHLDPGRQVPVGVWTEDEVLAGAEFQQGWNFSNRLTRLTRLTRLSTNTAEGGLEAEVLHAGDTVLISRQV